jgi:hypothetical protein
MLLWLLAFFALLGFVQFALFGRDWLKNTT